MIDLKDIEERRNEIFANIKNRYMNCDIDALIELQKERSAALKTEEALRARRNEIANLMKKKMDQQERMALISEGKELKVQIAEKEKETALVEEKYQALAKQIPNYSHPDAPLGKEDKDNTAIKFWGTIPKFNFQTQDHVQLGESLDLIDFETARKVSGPKFYYLKNKAVILQMALERYAIDIVMKHGFTPMITPDVAKLEVLEGIGFNPRGAETNIYSIQDTDTCLVGTAEITLGGYFANTIIEKEKLPIKFTGLSHCFRREAGGAGQYSKGLYRVHQFSKLEMFIFCLPEQSDDFHQQLLKVEEEIFQGLNIPYRVVDTCTGDLGAPAYRKFDIEAWMPGRGENGEYGEVTSTSNCTDYQSRSLNIRYKDDDGKIQYVHMLNGTAVALSRVMVALLENYQTPEGFVNIPENLIPYTGFKQIN